MTDTVIKVENLSKRYRLGELHRQTGSFRENFTQVFNSVAHSAEHKTKNPMPSAQDAPPHALSPMSPSSDDYFWALRNVSFEVKQGEIIGIIGRNGAGKSTLLKVLSRITKPTKGKALINGRVGSLLEVGTGFHPELTGRENIYLNGAILGMKKKEITSKFDGIVDFAEVEKFIDTPVKRFSSGMYVRLAFAVAAYLDHEILLVDEVLAVGDAQFQRKCLGKMSNDTANGRTVLFVSHNMNAIQKLCLRTLHLDKGKIYKTGNTAFVIENYLKDVCNGKSKIEINNDENNVFREVVFLNRNNSITTIYSMGELITVSFRIYLNKSVTDPMMYIRFNSELNQSILITGSYDLEEGSFLKVGEHVISVEIEQLLTPGVYKVDVIFAAARTKILTEVLGITEVTIQAKNLWKSGWLPPSNRRACIAKSVWMFDNKQFLSKQPLKPLT